MGNSKSTKRDKPAQDIVAYSESNTADGTLQLLRGRMDRIDAELQSLRETKEELHRKQLYFEKRADEAISTYGYNVQLIMLFHGLGSVFLQVNYPYAGAGVSVVMVVSFFSAFIVATTVIRDKNKRMSESEKNLQRQLMELQNEVSNIDAKIKASCSNQEFNTLAIQGTLTQVRACIDSLGKDAVDLQAGITKILELSTNSKDSRLNSFLQVAVVAIIYGLCFPTIAYYFLCPVGFKRAGPLGMMQQY